MPNPFVHIELQTRDVGRATEFYSKLFDSKFEDVPMPGRSGSYTLIQAGDGPGGGMFINPDPNVPPHWLAYVGVEDIRAATERARELGATICLEAMEVGEHGWMSVFIDPTGATLALWQGKGGK